MCAELSVTDKPQVSQKLKKTPNNKWVKQYSDLF